MKKKINKLGLAKETLRGLEGSGRHVAGGLVTVPPGACNLLTGHSGCCTTGGGGGGSSQSVTECVGGCSD
jgi:hypothetical protein